MDAEQQIRLFIYALCKSLEHAVCAQRYEQATELVRCLQRVQGVDYVEVIA